jgi:hypothetical protein
MVTMKSQQSLGKKPTLQVSLPYVCDIVKDYT